MLIGQTLSSILVVEHHDEVRGALRDWLLTSLPPLRLREARSMEEALRCAEQVELDLVLMNLELPGPNGIEATREMRKRHPSCAVVIMSVNDSEALRTAAIDAGAHAFVSKRELPNTLLPILERLGRMSPNLLLVDDDRSALFALRELLSDLDAGLHFAQTGEEALRRVLKQQFAAILLDVRLPGMDGFEVAAAIRSLERSRRTPIIFMSAGADRRARARAGAEAEIFLQKPLVPEVVRGEVAALLSRACPPERASPAG